MPRANQGKPVAISNRNGAVMKAIKGQSRRELPPKAQAKKQQLIEQYRLEVEAGGRLFEERRQS
jgi:hypothetical protein